MPATVYPFSSRTANAAILLNRMKRVIHMRIFVTGATGFVGSAVVRELIRSGYQVLGLARTEAAARSLIAAGTEVHMGDLDDPESLQRGAQAADGVIHTAFNHDFSKFKENCDTDRRAIEAIGSVLAGSGRPFIVTSAMGMLPPGRVTEKTIPVFRPAGNPRADSEKAVDLLAAKGVLASIIRLAPSVHGEGDHGFVPTLINIAREKGVSAYIGQGLNRWPAVHRLDAARLYRLILEKGAAGMRYHAAAEEGIPFREIAEAIGRGLNVPAVSLTPEEAAGHFGWFASFAAMDITAASLQTRELTGWEPAQDGLIADLNGKNYFGD